MRPAGGGGVEWDLRKLELSFPSLYSGPAHTSRTLPPTPAAPPPSPPTWAPAVDSAAGTRRSLFTAQERPGTTGLSLAHFFFFFFSPAKNVIKGREGRPRKHTDCIRLDSELLSGKMANALRVTLHLSSQSQDQRQPSHWWAESPGLLADSSL